MADMTGERLGPFEIQSLIGVGGFASVYLATDPRLDADVAIKVLAENHSLNPDIRSRFLSEATALRRVDSPSVIQLHDIRETSDGRPYLVMAFADRGDLATRIRDRVNDGWEPGPRDALALVDALSDALDAIHGEQLVHRDVTPSNLLIRSGRRTTAELGVSVLAEDERFVLSDLGLAKDLAQGSGLTRGGGTAGFSAPEQQQPLAQIDGRTDIYAASALMVWFLTGAVPAALADWSDSIRNLGWSSELVLALKKGLADDPADRHQSILGWQRELNAAITRSEDRFHKVAVDVPHKSFPQRGSLPARRYAFGALVIGFVALAGLLAFTSPEAGQGGDELSSGADDTQQPAAESVQVTVSVSDDDSAEQDADPVQEPTSTTSATPTPAQGLVYGYDESVPSQSWERPGLFEPILDPAYGTLITRIGTASESRLSLEVNSKRYPENADGTHILLGNGPDRFEVNSVMDGSPVATLDIDDFASPNWHPTDPGLVRHLVGRPRGDLKLYELEVATGARIELADLTDRIAAVFPTATEIHDRRGGAPSKDGSRYVWYLRDETAEIVGAVSYDLAEDRILGTLAAADFPDAGQQDGIFMALSGEYIVSAQWTGTYVFDADFTNERLIFPGFFDSGDVALNDSGGDSYVYFDSGTGTDSGWLVSADLASLERTRIFDLFADAGTQIDVSGRGFNKPGWVVASTYDCKVDFAWSCNKIMAVEMKPEGQVLNLAHTYHCGKQGWYSTEAAVNQDFSRIYFNSDTGRCDDDVEPLRIDVPAFG